MVRWRSITLWEDYVIFWRGVGNVGRSYRVTPERRRRLEALLGDAIEPARPGQSWLWSWDDWDWHNIGGK